MSTDKENEFYIRLENELADKTHWPSPYLYKFIVPTDVHKIKYIAETFNDTNAEVSKKESKNGKYTAVSIKVTMASPKQVIQYYKELSVIEGIISL